MNKNILAIAICIALVAGIYAASAAESGTPSNYTLTVTSAQNTALNTLDTALDEVLAGAVSTTASTFTLNNTGNVAANVSAQFTTNATGANASTYGLVNGTNVIPGTSFYLNATTESGAYIPLSASATGTLITVEGNAVVADSELDYFDVQVTVPAAQVSAIYTGTVQLTFSNYT